MIFINNYSFLEKLLKILKLICRIEWNFYYFFDPSIKVFLIDFIFLTFEKEVNCTNNFAQLKSSAKGNGSWADTV